MNAPTPTPKEESTADAIVNALTALTVATALALPPERRALFAKALGQIAQGEERLGGTQAESILIGMHSAVMDMGQAP